MCKVKYKKKEKGKKREKRERIKTQNYEFHENLKDDSNVATGMKYDVASFLSCFESICSPETSITRNRGAPKSIASF